MPIIIKNESNFVPAPDGVHEAVCVDVVDLGMVDTQFGAKHKIKFVFEIAELMENKKRFTIGQRFNVSMHKKSTLRAFLKTWRGRDFTEEEMKSFDAEKVIGAPAQIIVTHDEKEGEIYANITGIVRSKNPLKPSGEYKRAKDREDYKAPVESKPRVAQPPTEADKWDAQPEAPPDDEVPF